MADAKHTPGPWKLEGNWDARNPRLGGWVSTMHPSPLFELTPVTGEPGEIVANAQLIASVPTMADYIQSRADAGDVEAVKIMEAVHGAR